MKMTRANIGILTFLSALSLAAPAFADEADRLFEEGGAAFNERKYADAHRSFEAAWKLRQSYDIAGGLAQAEIQLGKHREAAEHLAFALRTFPATGDAGLRKTLEAAFGDVRKQVAAVRVIVNIDGAEVRVDGAPVGRAPLVDEVFLSPGMRRVEARLAKHVTTSLTFDAKRGIVETVRLSLVPELTPPAEPNRLPATIAFATGGAGLLVGAITGAVSLAKYGDVKSVCTTDLLCPAPLRAEADAGKALGHVATAGFVVAGLGAAAGITLLFVSPSKSPAQATLRIGPGFVGVKGAF